jgi:thiol-disulfide isomerase/thioredoxin
MIRSLLLLTAGALCPSLTAQVTPDIKDFEFEVETLDGRRVTQADFEDKVLLIDFWGTWCVPCRKAVPHLVKLHEKYEAKGLVILGLSYEQERDDAKAREKVRLFAEEHDIPYLLALGTKAIRAQVPDLESFPTMLLFRRGLRLDGMEVGFNDEIAARVDDWVESAVKEKAPPKKPVLLQRTFEAVGGEKLVIGDGKQHLLLVLTHPKASPDPADLAALRAQANKSPGSLRIVLLTRDDLKAEPGVLRLKRPDLAVMNLGKAFPAYRLYSPTGAWLFRDAGRGKDILKGVMKAVEGALKGGKKGAKGKKGEKAKKG